MKFLLFAVPIACLFLPCACNGGSEGVAARGSTGGTAGQTDDNSCVAPPPLPAIPLDMKPADGFIAAGFDPGAPTVKAPSPPPPIAGGTLSVLADGVTAVAADPDRDRVFVVDLAGGHVRHEIVLQPGDEPGRHVQDSALRVHVILRGGAAIATIDPTTGALSGRRSVCPEPRGIAYEAERDLLFVACAGGEFFSIAPTGSIPLAQVRLPVDLRDVVIQGDKILVSRFRASEILVLDRALTVVQRLAPPLRIARFLKGKEQVNTEVEKSPAVAWRMALHPTGGAILLHQRGSNAELDVGPGGYLLDECQGLPVESAVTRFDVSAARTVAARPFSLLPLLVDVAVSPDAGKVAVVSAAMPADRVFPSAVVVFDGVELQEEGREGCIFPPSVVAAIKPDTPQSESHILPPPSGLYRAAPGQLVAVAFTANGNVVVQSREPARLEIITLPTPPIVLADNSRRDTGHDLFHQTTPGVIACASCHPEGGEDGRVWKFARIGGRRTQSLRGGITDTAPFHWDGDLRDLSKLLAEVYTGRMGGHLVNAEQASAAERWLASIPNLRPSPPVDKETVTRGRELFFSARTRCGSCHRGDDFASPTNTAVGTGGCFQVPQLHSLAFRAPYLHDGCAATLRDRFTTCGGKDQHGRTSILSAVELDDLIAFLESL
jgi:hypothetical protein